MKQPRRFGAQLRRFGAADRPLPQDQQSAMQRGPSARVRAGSLGVARWPDLEPRSAQAAAGRKKR